MNCPHGFENQDKQAGRFIALSVAMFWLLAGSIAQAQSSDPGSREEVLTEFLEKFDRVSNRGFVRTQRAGDTGIGYTLETLLEIAENNAPVGDFRGMEIKAYRDKEDQFDDQEKMNLFLKEPEWVDGLNAAQRVHRYGYRDPNDRPAWYLSVTNQKNEANLQLKLTEKRDALLLLFDDVPIGRWDAKLLQKRLMEKHSHTVFVAAESRGEGADEEFWYRTVTWCQDPAIDRLLHLVDSGDVIVELRMHLQSNGSVRNHGTAFRVRKHRLQDLFEKQERVRPQ